MDLLNQKQERKLVYIALAVFALVMIVLAITTDGTGDWGDAISHYFYSRYAFAYPEHFLNHWAKPLFVLFTAPIAQGGFLAMKLFNVALLVTNTYLAWRVGCALHIPNAWLAIFPMMTAPMNISHTLSGLTEPMFAFWLILGILWYLEKRESQAVLWLSFLPFVRSEGLIIFCVLVIFLALKKQWRLIPLLAVGHLVYSVVGYPYYQDFLWVFNKMSYATVNGAYGSGTFWHYANKMNEVVGDFQSYLLVIGLLAGGVRLLQFYLGRASFPKNELWLLYGISVAYFLAHSIFWYFGIFNSFGLTRVFIGVLPLYALLIVQAFNFVVQWIPSLKIQLGLATALTLSLFYYLDKGIDINFHLAPASHQKGQRVLIEKYAAQYPDYIYYVDALHPALVLDIDWFDVTQHRHTPQLFTGEPIPAKSLVLWDDWFAAYEYNTPLEDLMEDPRFQLIECLETGYEWENPKKKNCLFVFDSTYADKRLLLEENFENSALASLDTTYSKSGKYSQKLYNAAAFSQSFSGWMNSFQHQKEAKIRVSCWAYLPKSSVPSSAIAVISFESFGKSFSYNTQAIFSEKDSVGVWKYVSFEQVIPEPKQMRDIVKTYIWNPSANPIYIDDLRVEWE